MGKRRFEKMKERRRAIARERIQILMDLAEERAMSGDLQHASRYASLARRIGMRYNVRMPGGHKLAICRKCGSYLFSSRTARFRLTGNRLTRQCLKCGSYYRIPLKRREEVGQGP
jgi:ribonuclease P protein subunit RPR2